MTSTPGPLVIKLGGRAIDSAHATPKLWQALAALQRAELASSFHQTGIAIVHGGGGAVDRLLTALNLQTTRHDGIRVTPPDQIDHVVSVLAGSVNTALVGALAATGASPVGLSLADGDLTTAESISPDLGRVGHVTGGDPTLIQTLWQAGFLPVVSSIAADHTGLPLNINADDAAAALARILDARALVLLTDVPGVLDPAGALIESLTPDDAATLIEDKAITGGMIAKVRAAIRAADTAGVHTVIAPWNDPAALESLAAGNNPGTTILPTQNEAAAPLSTR